jgi:hypothetical protein
MPFTTYDKPRSPNSDLFGNLVAEMAARRHAALVICIHYAIARRPSDVQIWLI